MLPQFSQLHVRAACWLATLGSATSGLAADVRPFQLDYQAPESCPSRAEFVAQLQARVPLLVEATTGQVASRFRVTAQFVEHGVEASIEMTLPDGASSRRDLHAADCGEAISAAAVVVALVLPEAASAPPDDPPEDAPPAEPEPVPEVQSTDQAALDEAPPLRLTLRRPVELQLAGGGQVGVSATMLGATIGGGGFGEVTFFPDVWIAPSVRLAFLAQGRDFETQPGVAEVKLRTGRLSACPVRLPAEASLFVRLCALGELGRLRGQGQGLDEERSDTFLWAALGASLRAVWNLPVVAVEIEGAAVFPLVRDRFVFDAEPVVEVFAVPAVQASALIGLSARWP